MLATVNEMTPVLADWINVHSTVFVVILTYSSSSNNNELSDNFILRVLSSSIKSNSHPLTHVHMDHGCIYRYLLVDLV